jgi:hypothetical protein
MPTDNATVIATVIRDWIGIMMAACCMNYNSLVMNETIWIADAHRGAGKRFAVRADEKLTAL